MNHSTGMNSIKAREKREKKPTTNSDIHLLLDANMKFDISMGIPTLIK